MNTSTIVSMNFGAPLDLITPTVDSAVLQTLATATESLTVTELRTQIGRYSPEGIRRVLVRLDQQGIVTTRVAGRTALYTFNRNHLAAPAITELTELRAVFIDRLERELAEWAIQTPYAALFGSVARRAAHRASDVDVFVVRPNDANDAPWSEQLRSLRARIHEWTGNQAEILEYSENEVTAGMRNHDPVLAEIQSSGIPISGPPNYLEGQQPVARSHHTR